ncbi:CvpA family protein [Chloroflexota bacterium]
MNWLDTIILIVMASGVLLGFRIGIIKAVLSLAGLIAGIFLAGRFYLTLAGWLSFILQTGIAKVVSFTIILIGTTVVASLLARLLRWAASKVMLGWAERFGGAVLGLMLGSILCSAILATWINFLDANSAINESRLAAILLDRLPAVLALLPPEFDAVRFFFK